MKLTQLGSLRRSKFRILTIALVAAACLALPAANASAGLSEEVTITVGPAEGAIVTTSSVNVEFEYVGPGTLNNFICSIDGGPPAPCTSPLGIDGLADGQHSFAVFANATDMVMNCVPGPLPIDPPFCFPMPMPYVSATTTRNFTVAIAAQVPVGVPDTTAPAASIDSGPAEGARVDSGSASFGVSGEAGAALTCALDAAAPVACGPLFKTGPLISGLHKFVLTATDAAGNATSVTRRFRVLNCRKIRMRNRHGKVVKTRSGAIRYKTVC